MIPITIAQVSDTHLLANPQEAIRGCYTYQTLSQILIQVQAANVDVLLLTGDLADRGEPEAYHHLLDLLKPLRIPIYWVSGNHDSLEQVALILGNHYPGVTDQPRSFPVGNWQLILLASAGSVSHQGEGYLSVETLNWLETELNRIADRPCIIALHHHPLPVGIDWLDQISVVNGQDLLKTIDRFPVVKVVVFGHIHWAFQTQIVSHQFPEIRHSFYGCPSSGLQVMPPHAIEGDKYPGFRLITLFENGTHETTVQRFVIPNEQD